MSSPERSDNVPNSDYALKWHSDFYRQGKARGAEGEGDLTPSGEPTREPTVLSS
jgi:hypothetical protein